MITPCFTVDLPRSCCTWACLCVWPMFFCQYSLRSDLWAKVSVDLQGLDRDRLSFPHCQTSLPSNVASWVFYTEFNWCSVTMCVCVSAIIQCTKSKPIYFHPQCNTKFSILINSFFITFYHMSWSIALISYREFSIVICIKLWHEGIVTPLVLVYGNNSV